MRWSRVMPRATALFVLLVLACCLGSVDSLAGRKANEDRTGRRAGRQFLGEAKSALAAGDSDRARAYLDSLQVVDPGHQDIPFLGAQLRLAAADTAGAEALLAEGLERSPLSSRLKLLSARVLMARGRTNEASELVTAVLAVNPGDSEAGYLDGAIALAESDTVLALNLWELVLEAELGGGK